MTKKDIQIFYISILGILVAVLVLYLYKHIDVAEAIQILLTFTLVSATIIYVRRTAEIAKASKEQAEATMKMAKEMQNQRYDMARPVIDIEVKPLRNIELAKQAYTEKEQLKLPKTLSCKIRNIGFGPAIDTYVITLLDDNKPARDKLGVIKVNDELRDISLSLEERDENKFLIVYYRDIYGRSFESTREIIMSLQHKAYTFGILNTSRTKGDENSND